MAEGKTKKAKAPTAQSGPNTARRSGKAWKRRPCGVRHAPGGCVNCVAKTEPSHEQWVKSMNRRQARDDREQANILRAAKRKRQMVAVGAPSDVADW